MWHRAERAAVRTRRTLGPSRDARTNGANWRSASRLEQRGCRNRSGTHRAGQRSPSPATIGPALRVAVQKAQERRTMSEQPPIRVFSVDDHPLLREGIAAIINSQPDMLLVAQAANGTDALQKYKEHQPDVTLMDLRLPDISGIDVLISIRAQFPAARVIMLTTFEGDVEIQRALEAGARGYMLKSMPPRELVEVIRQVHSGKK